jgi:hypothetical protein
MTDFKPGDIVDITIRARVVEMIPGGALRFTFRQPEHFNAAPYPHVIATNSPDLTFELVAPAEWPPQPGDLWRDKHGELWFIHCDPPDGLLMARTADGERWTPDASRLIEDNGPLTLAYREPVAE